MARLKASGGGTLAGRRQSGSQLKVALLALVVLGAVLGMVNMAPDSLHLELHSSSTRKELRELTEGTRSVERRQQQEERGLEAADGLAVQQEGLAAGKTQIIEHTFDTPDGTDADDSLAAAQQAEEERKAAEEERRQQEAAKPDEVNTTPGEKYHVICSLGAGMYVQWQSRVAYYWYLRTKEKCEAEEKEKCRMGGYTRLLHSGQPDDFMDEIPTVVVQPLPEEYQRVAAGYVVLDRPYAFKQWVDKYLDTIPENYIWMGEPDHVFLRPPPLWATPERPAAFPFFYIEPPRFKGIIDRFNPNGVPIDQFDTIGNSPVQIHKRQFAALADNWFKLSIAIKNDTEADREFGWVQEMYAYSIAAATSLDQPVRHQLHVEMQLQPPWDTKLTAENGKPAFMIHFTYGDDFNQKGEFTPGKVGFWHWDKRDYTYRYPPKNFPMPPEGCTNVCVQELIRRVNEAADNLPRWDEFAAQLFTPTAALETTDVGEGQQQEEKQRRRRQLLGYRPRPLPATAPAG